MRKHTKNKPKPKPKSIFSKLSKFPKVKKENTHSPTQNKNQTKQNDKTKQKRTNKKQTFWESMSRKSNNGIKSLNSSLCFYKIKKAPEKQSWQLKKKEGKKHKKTKKQKWLKTNQKQE